MSGSLRQGLVHTVGLHGVLKPLYVVAHDQQIVTVAVLVDHMITQQTFRAKAQTLERGDGALLVRRHAGHDLFHIAGQSHGKSFLGQKPDQALVPGQNPEPE